MSIAVIDYGMGNLQSVINAFRAIGADAVVIAEPAALDTADRIVLPGVGAFGNGMQKLRERGWIEALERNVAERGKPFLGICLGMQLLARTSSEHGLFEGLGWVNADVKPLQITEPMIRVPHVGWNTVHFMPGSRLFAGSGKEADFYFVHSFAIKADEKEVGATGVCRHGEDFIAGIELDNIFAVQFHPEKSQKAGLDVLRSFNEVGRGDA